MIKTIEDHALLIRLLAKQLGAKVCETHISSVIVAHGHAWKIKKPLDLGFLDFSTLEKRRHYCHEEIRLNSRLAADVYQKVVAISGSADAPQLEGEGDAIEYAVQMREFPSENLLVNELQLLNREHMHDLARQIVEFQKKITKAEPGSVPGSPESVLGPMLDNFTLLRTLVDHSQDLQRLDVLEKWTVERYRQLYPILQQRQQDGFIGEGHGDLHLGNIVLEGERLIIFDGIEFSEEICWIDHVSEIAFLMMDLDRVGRTDLSQYLLNQWLIYSGDFEGLRLVRFYQLYRAMVRAKVAAIRLGQQLSDAEKLDVMEAYREYLALAERYMLPDDPMLIIASGPSGSGKSVAARRLVATMPAIQISSDIERKRLAGLSPLSRTNSSHNGGIYTPQMSAKTYQRLVELSEIVIDAGFTAVADATFLQQPYRRPFMELAQRLGVKYRILDIQVPVEELQRRVQERLQRGDDPAEADVNVLNRQLASIDGFSAEEQPHVVTVTDSRNFQL
ncbi:MAG: AAA family ATPase [Pseudomonadota bacterium]|nr:AAA family ATPase [Pseudomonadota bacterium]